MNHMAQRKLKTRLFELGVVFCGGFEILVLGAVFSFLLTGALPALRHQGLFSMLISPVWAPEEEQFGLAAILCCTIAASIGAVVLALPIALFSAACIDTLLPKRMANLIRGLFEMVSGLPSVLLGLLGLMTLLPALTRLFPNRMAQSGGASLLAAMLVLAVMMLPELILALQEDLAEAKGQVGQSSLALGATPIQTVFRAQIPAASWHIRAAAFGGMRRAAAEGVAVLLVSGNVVRFPSLFSGARTLASGMILEMGYASGLHRSALFAMALLLLLFALLLGRLSRSKK